MIYFRNTLNLNIKYHINSINANGGYSCIHIICVHIHVYTWGVYCNGLECVTVEQVWNCTVCMPTLNYWHSDWQNIWQCWTKTTNTPWILKSDISMCRVTKQWLKL